MTTELLLFAGTIALSLWHNGGFHHQSRVFPAAPLAYEVMRATPTLPAAVPNPLKPARAVPMPAKAAGT